MGVIQTFYGSAANRKLGLMLDLDGATLHRKPGVHNPVEPDLEYDSALLILAQAGLPIAINTGRPLIFVDNVFPNLTKSKGLPIFISTETGANILGPDRRQVFSKPIPNIIKLREVFRAEANKFEDAFVEDHKMCAITIALKKCPQEIRRNAYDHIVACAEKIKGQDANIHCIAVWKDDDVYVEIIPNGVDKGTATTTILSQRAYDGFTPFAFGDSKADEPMMSVVRNRGGHAIGVGNHLEPQCQDINFTDYHQSQILIKTAAEIVSGKITLEQALRSAPIPRAA